MKRDAKDKQAEQWTAAAWDMLYLIQCGINSMVPDPERTAKMDLEKVYAKSKNQSLEALTYMALDRMMEANPHALIPEEKPILLTWKDAKNKAIAKNLMMDAAREQLFAFLEEHGIWHMALKGAVLCHMYPKYGMRQMSDNDILFDPMFRQEVHDWFVEQGYEVESFQKHYHDVYCKKPIYNFEMHTVLFSQNPQFPFAKYYLTIKDKLIVVPGKKFEYHMTNEDLYLYIIAHDYKHYVYSGRGLRFLLDIYVCNNATNHMDRNYLDEELNKTGLFEFEHQMRELAFKVFSPKSMMSMDTLSEEEQAILNDLLSSSTYGSKQSLWNYEMRRLQPDAKKISVTVKLRYLLHRLFPDQDTLESWCQRHAPYFLRHRWLMPLAVIWRMVKSGIETRKKIKEELDTIRKA